MFLDEVYRLPFEHSLTTVVDLGANIGLTSLWLHRRYGFRRGVAIEPSAMNAALAERDLRKNDVPAVVHRAAVGKADGMARYARGLEPNLGRIVWDTDAQGADSHTDAVRVVSMPTVVEELGGAVSLVKIDIEGSEEAILDDPSWLDRTEALIVEFHPDAVDYPRLTKLIESRGFRFFPVGSAYERSSDAFLRTVGAGDSAGLRQ